MHMSWIDATCQHELLESLSIGVDLLPTVVLYRPRSGKLSSLLGAFTEKAIGALQSCCKHGAASDGV